MARHRAEPALHERMGLVLTTQQRQTVEDFAALHGINLSEAIRRMIERSAVPGALDPCGADGDGHAA